MQDKNVRTIMSALNMLLLTLLLLLLHITELLSNETGAFSQHEIGRRAPSKERHVCIKVFRSFLTFFRAMWINLLGVIGLQSALCYVGLVIFTRYNDCDPISTRQVAAADQVNPFFVMDILGSYPGVPGLIVSGIFSGGLSGVSASLSSLATTTLQDIVKTYIKPDLGDRAAGILLKVLTVVFGVIVVAMVYVAQQMGDVLQSALSILGIVGGPLVGVYSLGIFVPFANSIGAITGLVAGVTTLSWISVGAYLRRPFHWRPPVSVNGCVPLYLNATGLEQPVIPSVNIDAHNSQIEYIYRLSYLWYSFLGAFIVLVLGSFISLLTVRWSKPVEERLLIRITCKCFSRRGTQQDVKSPSVDNDISHGIGPFFVEPIVTDSSQHNLAGLATSSESPVTLLTTSKKQKPLEELSFRTLNGTVQNKVSNRDDVQTTSIINDKAASSRDHCSRTTSHDVTFIPPMA